MGRRRRDARNGFVLPPDVTAANFAPEAGLQAHVAVAGESAVAAHTRLAFDPSLTWADLEDLRSRTGLPLILKGVLAPEDAVRAVECGVQAVVVSNHGGRQLDGAVASVDALEAVCEAVAGRCAVLLDSGIRSGTDVLRALALGATGVLVGRPVMWGLGVDGASGVGWVLDLLAEELRDALGLAGCPTVADAARLRTARSPGSR
jgi:4-hydroxymandelate oxidase